MNIRLLAYGAVCVALAIWASIRDENKNFASCRQEDELFLVTRGPLGASQPLLGGETRVFRARGEGVMAHEPLQQEVYRIIIKGHLDSSWSAWFDGLTIVQGNTGETVLFGPLPDQTALHGVLNKVRDLGLPLLSVQRIEPDADNVLM